MVIGETDHSHVQGLSQSESKLNSSEMLMPKTLVIRLRLTIRGKPNSKEAYYVLCVVKVELCTSQNTAVSRKVVLQTGISLRDKVESYNG